MLSPSSPFTDLSFIHRSVRMPSIPGIFNKVSSIAANPNSSVREMAKIIEEDQSVAMNTLKIANSAAFGLRSRVASIEQACSALGMLRVRSIVLQTSLMQHYSSINVPDFSLERFWRHAALTGLVCRIFAQSCQSRIGITPDEAYTAGLLHDIGIIVMLDSFPSAYMEAIARANKESLRLEEAEQKIFGFNHAEVGAALAQYWKLPSFIALAARWHHEIPEDTFHENVCVLVALSNQIAASMENGARPFELQQPLQSKVEELLGLIAHDISKEIIKITELVPGIEL